MQTTDCSKRNERLKPLTFREGATRTRDAEEFWTTRRRDVVLFRVTRCPTCVLQLAVDLTVSVVCSVHWIALLFNIPSCLANSYYSLLMASDGNYYHFPTFALFVYVSNYYCFIILFFQTVMQLVLVSHCWILPEKLNWICYGTDFTLDFNMSSVLLPSIPVMPLWFTRVSDVI